MCCWDCFCGWEHIWQYISPDLALCLLPFVSLLSVVCFGHIFNFPKPVFSFPFTDALEFAAKRCHFPYPRIHCYLLNTLVSYPFTITINTFFSTYDCSCLCLCSLFTAPWIYIANTRYGEDFKTLLDKKAFADVQFVLGKDIFSAHKTILCASSAVFRSGMLWAFAGFRTSISDLFLWMFLHGMYTVGILIIMLTTHDSLYYVS